MFWIFNFLHILEIPQHLTTISDSEWLISYNILQYLIYNILYISYIIYHIISFYLKILVVYNSNTVFTAVTYVYKNICFWTSVSCFTNLLRIWTEFLQNVSLASARVRFLWPRRGPLANLWGASQARQALRDRCTARARGRRGGSGLFACSMQ